MKTILCFGDSNTWGAVPNENRRYTKDERWPALVRKYLPDSWDVVEEGQSGRTTIHIDPFENYKCGLTYLPPCLETHLPDLVIIMLGTNDLKSHFNLSASDISRGAAKLAEKVQKFTSSVQKKSPKVLLIAPPPVKEVGYLAEMFEGAEAKSQDFDKYYSARAKELGCEYFNAGAIIESCPIEGIHWRVEQHEKMSLAISEKIMSIL